jgi:hypothetical protein
MHVFPYIAGAAFSIDAVKKFVFPRISQIGINYRHSSISDHESDGGFDVKAGDRLPFFTLEGASIFDRLRAPKFHILSFSDGQNENTVSELSDEFKNIVDVCELPIYPRVAEVFGTDKSFRVLLRPDNYIATISTETSLAPIENYLKRCL